MNLFFNIPVSSIRYPVSIRYMVLEVETNFNFKTFFDFFMKFINIWWPRETPAAGY